MIQAFLAVFGLICCAMLVIEVSFLAFLIITALWDEYYG